MLRTLLADRFKLAVHRETRDVPMWALVIAGGIVLLFNTASIFAMISHYSGDKEHIYGLDLHYLDALRAKA